MSADEQESQFEPAELYVVDHYHDSLIDDEQTSVLEHPDNIDVRDVGSDNALHATGVVDVEQDSLGSRIGETQFVTLEDDTQAPEDATKFTSSAQLASQNSEAINAVASVKANSQAPNDTAKFPPSEQPILLNSESIDITAAAGFEDNNQASEDTTKFSPITQRLLQTSDAINTATKYTSPVVANNGVYFPISRPELPTADEAHQGFKFGKASLSNFDLKGPLPNQITSSSNSRSTLPSALAPRPQKPHVESSEKAIKPSNTETSIATATFELRFQKQKSTRMDDNYDPLKSATHITPDSHSNTTATGLFNPAAVPPSGLSGIMLNTKPIVETSDQRNDPPTIPYDVNLRAAVPAETPKKGLSALHKGQSEKNTLSARRPANMQVTQQTICQLVGVLIKCDRSFKRRSRIPCMLHTSQGESQQHDLPTHDEHTPQNPIEFRAKNLNRPFLDVLPVTGQNFTGPDNPIVHNAENHSTTHEYIRKKGIHSSGPPVESTNTPENAAKQSNTHSAGIFHHVPSKIFNEVVENNDALKERDERRVGLNYEQRNGATEQPQLEMRQMAQNLPGPLESAFLGSRQTHQPAESFGTGSQMLPPPKGKALVEVFSRASSQAPHEDSSRPQSQHSNIGVQMSRPLTRGKEILLSNTSKAPISGVTHATKVQKSKSSENISNIAPRSTSPAKESKQKCHTLSREVDRFSVFLAEKQYFEEMARNYEAHLQVVESQKLEIGRLKNLDVGSRKKLELLESEKSKLVEKLKSLQEKSAKYTSNMDKVINTNKALMIEAKERKELSKQVLDAHGKYEIASKSIQTRIKELKGELTRQQDSIVEQNSILAKTQKELQITKETLQKAEGRLVEAASANQALDFQLKYAQKTNESLGDDLQKNLLHLSREQYHSEELLKQLNAQLESQKEVVDILKKIPGDVINEFVKEKGIMERLLASGSSTQGKLDEISSIMTELKNSEAQPSSSLMKVIEDLFNRHANTIRSSDEEQISHQEFVTKLFDNLKEWIKQFCVNVETHNALNEQVLELREAKATLTADKSAREVEVQNLTTQLDELQRDLGTCRTELTSKADELAKQLACPKEDPQLLRKIQELERSSSGLSEQLKSASLELAKTKEDLLSSEELSSDQADQICSLESTCRSAQAKIDRFKKEKQDLEAKYKAEVEKQKEECARTLTTSLSDQSLKHDSTLRNLRQKCSEKESEVRDAREEIHRLQNEAAYANKKFENELSAQESYKQQLAQQAAAIEKLQNRRPDLESLKNDTAEFGTFRNEIEELRNFIQTSRREDDDKIQAVSTYQENIDAEIQKLESLEGEKDSSEKKCAELSTQLDTALQRVQTLEAEMSSFKLDSDSRQQEMETESKSKISILEKENQTLRQQSAELQAQIAQIAQRDMKSNHTRVAQPEGSANSANSPAGHKNPQVRRWPASNMFNLMADYAEQSLTPNANAPMKGFEEDEAILRPGLRETEPELHRTTKQNGTSKIPAANACTTASETVPLEIPSQHSNLQNRRQTTRKPSTRKSHNVGQDQSQGLAASQTFQRAGKDEEQQRGGRSLRSRPEAKRGAIPQSSQASGSSISATDRSNGNPHPQPALEPKSNRSYNAHVDNEMLLASDADSTYFYSVVQGNRFNSAENHELSQISQTRHGGKTHPFYGYVTKSQENGTATVMPETQKKEQPYMGNFIPASHQFSDSDGEIRTAPGNHKNNPKTQNGKIKHSPPNHRQKSDLKPSLKKASSGTVRFDLEARNLPPENAPTQPRNLRTRSSRTMSTAVNQPPTDIRTQPKIQEPRSTYKRVASSNGPRQAPLNTNHTVRSGQTQFPTPSKSNTGSQPSPLPGVPARNKTNRNLKRPSGAVSEPEHPPSKRVSMPYRQTNRVIPDSQE
ncbi:hypothetical protein G7Y89_g10377 [Cudoniella acicularis]|uniref:Uncharacterized protein n=1 Tax=Cudoniella acicularis TaxID=354080 RepID=A0A8H4VZ43_9HELO|nr:hypothetical protein G7Y89_g10377 [Cudoniella acicularis]